MPNVPITIDGKHYNLFCASGQEEMLSVIVDNLDLKATKIRESFPQITDSLLLVMVAVLEAEDAYKIKQSQGLSVKSDKEQAKRQERENKVVEQLEILAKSL